MFGDSVPTVAAADTGIAAGAASILPSLPALPTDRDREVLVKELEEEEEAEPRMGRGLCVR